MWKRCNKEADGDTPLDYPHIFLCFKHYAEHKRLASRGTIMKVRHGSFSKLQRKRYLKQNT